jgi:hypothetical protein
VPSKSCCSVGTPGGKETKKQIAMERTRAEVKLPAPVTAELVAHSLRWGAVQVECSRPTA